MIGHLRKAGFLAIALTLVYCGGSGTTGPVTSNVAGQVLARGLSSPVLYLADPVNASRAYVLELGGKVKLLTNDVLQTTDVLDITGTVATDGECGLLGMAFDPNYASNRYVYLHYDAGSPIRTSIVRYTMNVGGTTLSNPQPIFSFEQPSTTNHKGGSINFGHDNMLYILTGDGGGGDDPNNYAQRGDSYLGKVIRIDPSSDGFPSDTEKNYSIPVDNPFALSTTVYPEIWAFGLRNPYRWNVDELTGGLIIADVGQGGYEEVNFEPAGQSQRNYGWRMREGLHATSNGGPAFSSPLTDPFVEYDHSFGRAIVGGFVYRGTQLDPSLKGRYFFADATIPKIASLPFSVSGGEANPTTMASVSNHTDSLNTSLGADSLSAPVCVAPDANGEVIVVDLYKGSIIRLVP
jgi:glucose/arabinose dehydrogenase